MLGPDWSAQVLTDKEIAWVNDYMQHFNASRASRNIGAEGRSPRRHGARMKARPEVAAEIQRRLALDTEKFVGLRHEVISMLAAAVQVDPARIYKRDGTLKAWSEIDPEDRMSIQALVEKEFDGGEAGGKSRSVTVKFKNGIQAAQTLMKLLGWEAKTDDDLGADHIREAAESFASKLDSLRRAKRPDQPSGEAGVPPKFN